MGKKKNWYRIDNAGKIYPSIISNRASTVFRLSADMKERVNPISLQKAVEKAVEVYPYFHTHLKSGFFWYYFVGTKQRPIIEKERFYPCMFLDIRQKRKLPFRVLYFNRKISFEISHSVTDGMGGFIFFKCLLEHYLKEQGVEEIETLEKNNFSKEERNEQSEDAFVKYYKEDIPFIDASPKKAYHFPFKLNDLGEYHIITGEVDSNELYKLAKSYGTSVTKFMVALYFDAIQEYVMTLPIKKRKKLRPIVINMPVNLRGLYPSKTLRNFFISLTPHIDVRIGSYTFEELIKYVNYYVDAHVSKRHIDQYISRNVRNEKRWSLRIIPLFLKNLVMPYVYQFYGENSYTSGVSNLGVLRFPPAMEEHIKRFDVYPPPSKGNKLKITMLSYKGKTIITSGSVTQNRHIETILFRKLRKMGLTARIETND